MRDQIETDGCIAAGLIYQLDEPWAVALAPHYPQLGKLTTPPPHQWRLAGS